MKQKDIRLVKGPASTWAQRALEEISGMVVQSAPRSDDEVLAELPVGVAEQSGYLNMREAWGYIEGEFHRYHFCDKCGGWVRGWPESIEVSTLSRLAGRRGVAHRCVRCKSELAFLGIVA